MNPNQLFFFLIALSIISGCSAPNEAINQIIKQPKSVIELPLDYCSILPTPSFEQWDKDYNYYNKFLNAEILQTQMGISYNNNGVHTWFCVPSARTHVQLDTNTMIRNSDKIKGQWRLVCNRKVIFEDSADYATEKIYRNSKIAFEDKQDDMFVLISDNKFKAYLKKEGKEKFRRIINKNYVIENNRFLLLYGAFKASAAVNFIGLDKNNRLIINNHFVEERRVKGKYIVYHAGVTQMYFDKVD